VNADTGIVEEFSRTTEKLQETAVLVIERGVSRELVFRVVHAKTETQDAL